MFEALTSLALFTAKALVIVLMILIVLFALFFLIAKSKGKLKGKLSIHNLNKHYDEMTEAMNSEMMTKKILKKHLKEKKLSEKEKLKKQVQQKNVFVINFHGDMKATAVEGLKQEVTAILNVAKENDEVVVRLESAGGTVIGYGLAAAELMRLRRSNIHITIAIDKVAASGGYLMACIGQRIIAAPFAVVGSIGVIVELPNFNRLLKEKNIEFEQHTAGEYKRTISLFGENTNEGRQKLQENIEDIHHLFKKVIVDHRSDIDIKKVATGEHWVGYQALDLKLIDDIKTSEDYLLEKSKEANLYELCYEIKKPLITRLTTAARAFHFTSLLH